MRDQHRAKQEVKRNRDRHRRYRAPPAAFVGRSKGRRIRFPMRTLRSQTPPRLLSNRSNPSHCPPCLPSALAPLSSIDRCRSSSMVSINNAQPRNGLAGFGLRRQSTHVGHDRMRTSPRQPKSGLRWPLLHRCSIDRNLLPAGLPGSSGAKQKRRILSLGSRRRVRRISALPSLPTGNRAVLAGLEWIADDGRTRGPADRQRRARSRWRGRTCGPPWRQRAPFEPAVPEAPRRQPHPGCGDEAVAAGETAVG